MTESELIDCTPRAFFNKWRGFQKMQQQRHQDEWERTRWMTFIFASPYIEDKSIKTAKQWCPFPWEEGFKQIEAKKTRTKEEVDAIFQKWEKPNENS